MFRFYDPRIFFVFVLSLSAGEAAAFMGPVRAVFGLQEGKAVFVSQTPQVANAKPMVIGVGGYVMSATQIAAFEEVVSDTFKGRLFDYFRAIWPRESAFLNDDELKEQINLAIKDAETFGSVREQDVLRISLVRILRPDIRQDEWIWDQVMNYENPNPKWKSGILHGYLTTDFLSLEELDYYHFQVARFSYDNFDAGTYIQETFPDLILRHRKAP